ncbi:MAG: hypothetical protein Q8P05_05560 [Candidatus Diapherotrites archaeon]|nr:hypothetical protein [Candidatus Diapherotrites archaeon]MDZ4256956.1 hypothetical protein [archaeon]
MGLNFTEAQKKLSQLLLAQPLSLEQLSQKSGMGEKVVQEEMKLLLQLKLVQLQGTPPLFAIKEEIGQELLRRKGLEQEDDNKFRLQITIEVQSIDEGVVGKQLNRILETLAKEPFFKVYSTRLEPTMKVEDMFSGFADVNLSVRDFRALIRLMFFYGPASVEVVKPAKIEFSLQDFQDGLVDMTEMVQGYASYIMSLLNRQKVDDFHDQLIQAAQKAEELRSPPPSPNPLPASPSPTQE